jgi:hypothetical protein
MPPQVLLLAAIGASFYAGYRLAYRALQTRKTKQTAKTTTEPPEARNLGDLVHDPKTGEYRPQP